MPKFVELYGGYKTYNQDLLFEEREVDFNDSNLFIQNYKSWNNMEILINELEVVGFYFSDHPLNHYPKAFFDLQKIQNFKKILNNDEFNTAKVCGAILDIKERSNKDGRKYAFLTISDKEIQYELSIFSENLYKFRPILKEGNLLIFQIDILRKNSDARYIVKDVVSLNHEFEKYGKKFSIYSSIENLIKVKDQVFEKQDSKKNHLDVYINIDNKLVNFNFNKYAIRSYKALDELKKSKILDYSLEIS